MTIEELALETLKIVRGDLSELKRCQLQYFCLSVTATGAIIGFAATVTAPSLRGLGMLAPLGLLLPCWIIFFDKSTTITRAVGHERLLERILTTGVAKCRWVVELETALSKFREAQDKGRLVIESGHPTPIRRVLLLQTRHRYWMLTWYTFLALSVLCCVLGYNFLSDAQFDFRLPLGIRAQVPERTLWGAPAFIAVIAVSLYTFLIVLSLVHGKDSYRVNALAWEKLVATEAVDNASDRNRSDSD